MSLDALENYRVGSFARRHRSSQPSIGRYSPLLRYREDPTRALQVSLPKPNLVEATEQRRQRNPNRFGRHTAARQPSARGVSLTAAMRTASADALSPFIIVFAALNPDHHAPRPGNGRSAEQLLNRKYTFG